MTVLQVLRYAAADDETNLFVEQDDLGSEIVELIFKPTRRGECRRLLIPLFDCSKCHLITHSAPEELLPRPLQRRSRLARRKRLRPSSSFLKVLHKLCNLLAGPVRALLCQQTDHEIVRSAWLALTPILSVLA